MDNQNQIVSVPIETIISRIYLIRGKKVMLDTDLASMYDVPVKVLMQSVKRNANRFPTDFMFQIELNEAVAIRSQFVTLKRGGHRKYMPYVFTEQGVAMLSSVLRSERAVQVNIQIIRTFTKLREILLENKTLAERLEKMELRYDEDIAKIFKVLRYLVKEEETPKEKMGFRTN
jgi:phage regulator Rha-like protein